jgi:hypothetical protein
MNSFLQSSLYGHEFVRYRKNNPSNIRKNFSKKIKGKDIGELPIVIDSVNEEISKSLAGPSAARYNRNGMEYHFHSDIIVDDIIRDVKLRIKSDKLLKLGLENGKILEGKDILGDIYKKYKDQNDDILYLLVTEEKSVYNYILSLLKYIFGESFFKHKSQ